MDGRLDREKLLELLAIGAEHDELDFKGTLDLQDAKQRLGLVLDVVAMMNTTLGGFIVIGAHDDGTPAHDLAMVETARFDSAALGALVARHIATQPRVTSQIHEVESRAHVLIHVAPTASGLPVIISTTGEYDRGDGRMKTVLHEGVLYVREGTRNVAASDAHWDTMLSRYRASIIAEAREGLDALIRRVVESTAAPTVGGRTLPPLLIDMDDASFVEALRQHVDSDSDAGIRRLFRDARTAATYKPDIDRTKRGLALDKLALAAIEARRSQRPETLEAALDTLHRVYLSAGSVNEYATNLSSRHEVSVAEHWLAVLVRVWLIGAAAEREQEWAALASIANRPVGLGSDERYPSWLRHGIVYASRANLFAKENHGGALILSMAREHATSAPSFVDDVAATDEVGSTNDEVLNSLTRFDIMWCLVMAVGAKGDLAYHLYPSAAALNEARSTPALHLVAAREDVRDALVPGATDAEWAVAIDEVLDLAVGQSRQHGTFWRGVQADHAVSAFVVANASNA
ncbi:putative DNA binding domain-containing protein [Microbacterium sp. BG28]|nr:putative DNA binding domain-containing protein [Microbacterium sp. BG28]